MRRLIQWRALAAMAVALAASGAFAAEEWVTDFDQAKRLAAERKVPILADFSGSDWCGWCIKLDQEVLTQKVFKNFAKDNLVLFLADYPRAIPQTDEVRKQNEGLLKVYGVEGFPTVLLLDAKGKVIAGTGYREGGPEKYVAHLKELLAKGSPRGAPPAK